MVTGRAAAGNGRRRKGCGRKWRTVLRNRARLFRRVGPGWARGDSVALGRRRRLLITDLRCRGAPSTLWNRWIWKAGKQERIRQSSGFPAFLLSRFQLRPLFSSEQIAPRKNQRAGPRGRCSVQRPKSRSNPRQVSGLSQRPARRDGPIPPASRSYSITRPTLCGPGCPARASDGSPHPAANDVHGTRPGLGTDPRSRDPPKARLQRIGAVHRGVCVTTTLSESGVGRAASATAAAVSSNGNVWVTSDRTSKRREKTSRATSRWSVKSDE